MICLEVQVENVTLYLFLVLNESYLDKERI